MSYTHTTKKRKAPPKAITSGTRAAFKAKKVLKGLDESDSEESEDEAILKKRKTATASGSVASYKAKRKKTSDDSESEQEKVPVPERPDFKKTVKSNGIDGFNQATGSRVKQNQNLNHFNAAVPHRMDWSSLRNNTLKYVNGAEKEADFVRWTNRFFTASNRKIKLYKKSLDAVKNKIKKQTKAKTKVKSRTAERQKRLERMIKRYTKANKDLERDRKALINVVENKSSTVTDRERKMKVFLSTLNSFAANVPDIGPHKGVNLQVSNRPHLNATADGSLSPMSEQLGNMTPERLNSFPVSPTGQHVMTTSGAFVDLGFILNQYGSFAPHFKNVKKMQNLTEKTFDEDTGFEDK